MVFLNEKIPVLLEKKKSSIIGGLAPRFSICRICLPEKWWIGGRGGTLNFINFKVLFDPIRRLFRTNASFLLETANLQFQLSVACSMYYVIVHFPPQKHFFFQQKKNGKLRQI